ncbi:segregation and condensation protein A [Parvimonas parva]|uniref:Segregation and condensation protein A n=1 Tax=Parvimonas parva TaxID=2769485 RepID=A0ABS1C8B9_9FIRM|nr:segregation/condensation protein A [Parvimonas parva]MBK1468325.1 segregation/condensation protein A [Parvimonas parva]
MELVVNLDAYSGPLDLLLDLISKQKVDIYDIEISKITKYYLEVIENSVYGEDTDISAFLLMSSTLVEIKSRSLIPKVTDEEDEEIVTKEQLIERLIEYRKFKKVGEYFKNLETEGSKAYSKMQSDITEYITENKEIILNTDVNLLLTLMENIINQYKNKIEENSFEKIIEKDLFPIEKYISMIKTKIFEKKEVYFEDLIFYNGTKSELITIFMSILELVKNNFVSIFQDKDKNIKLNLVGDDVE